MKFLSTPICGARHCGSARTAIQMAALIVVGVIFDNFQISVKSALKRIETSRPIVCRPVYAPDTFARNADNFPNGNLSKSLFWQMWAEIIKNDTHLWMNLDSGCRRVPDLQSLVTFTRYHATLVAVYVRQEVLPTTLVGSVRIRNLPVATIRCKSSSFYWK